MTDLSHSREKDKINPVVFYTSAGLILLFFPDNDPVSRLLGPVDWPHAGLGF